MTHAEAGRRGGLARAAASTHDQRVAWGKPGAPFGRLGGCPRRPTISELRQRAIKIQKEEKLPGSLRELKLAWRKRVAAAA
jgi:hypothetical protein